MSLSRTFRVSVDNACIEAALGTLEVNYDEMTIRTVIDF